MLGVLLAYGTCLVWPCAVYLVAACKLTFPNTMHLAVMVEVLRY